MTNEERAQHGREAVLIHRDRRSISNYEQSAVDTIADILHSLEHPPTALVLPSDMHIVLDRALTIYQGHGDELEALP